MGLICEPLLYAFALVDTGTILFVLVYFVSFLFVFLFTFSVNLWKFDTRSIKFQAHVNELPNFCCYSVYSMCS